MAGKMMELLVSLKGQIDKSIPESVRKAMDDIGKLQKKQGDLKGIEARANQYKALEQAAQSLGEQFNQAKTKAAQLEAEFKRNQAAAAQYQAQISQAKAALAGMNRSANPEAYRAAKASIAQLTSAHKAAQAAAKASGRAFQQAEKSAKASGKEYSRNQADLQKLSDGLHQAGFNTQQFAASQDALQRELAETGVALAQAKQVKAQYDKQIEEQAKRQQAHNEAQQAFHNATENLQNTWYFAKDVATPFIAATKSAMQFQSAMADVRKVVDFDTPEQFKEMGSDILRLTRTLPMAAEDIAKIVAAGGQSGIARGDLLAFAESAAKMGVAFDITADQAGEMMAKWRTAFKLSQDDVVKLADQINYLGNTTAASAPLISDVVTRIGPLGEIGGVASGEIAALGASMIGAGVQTEIASTGIKNLILAMTAGESATGRQREAFAALGLDAQTMAVRMQTDAKGAILDLFKALRALPKEAQGANLSHLVGKESIAAIAPLLSNLEALRENFEKVGDASRYSGSMEAEFEARSKTAENALQLLRNATHEIAINIGNAFLPMVADAAAWVAKWADVISDLADEHPQLIRLVGVLTAAIAGAVLTALTVNAAVSGWKLLGTTFEMVAKSKALETIGSQTGSLLGTLKAAPGKIGNAIIGLPKTIAGAFGKIPNIIAGAGRAIMGIPAMISGAFTAIHGIVSSAFASLATVGLPVVLGILAIVAVVALVAANFDKLKETAIIVFNHISGTVAAWAAVLQAKFDAALNKIAEVWNSITGESMKGSEVVGAIINNLGFLFGAAFDVAAGIVGTAISVIINLVVSLAQIIGGVVNVIVGIFTGDWDRAWKGAGQAVEGFAGGTLGTFKTIADGVGSIFDALMGKSAEVQRQAEQAQASLAGSKMSNADAMRALRDAGGAEAIAEAQQTAAAAEQTAQATAEASAHAQELSANIQATGANAQQTTGYMAELQNIMTQVPGASQEALQQIPAQTQATFQQLPPMAQQGTDAMVQEFSQLAAKCKPGGDAFVQAANEWGRQAYENIANWSDQMAHVVVDKLSNAWSQISAQFSAGLNVNVSTSDTGIAHNAVGGIYKKGAFLTTFAEDSAEAAIPLDGTRNAVSLWQRAGEILGVLPKNTMQDIPTGIGAIAEMVSPPTEAQMAAAPVALEPITEGGDVHIEINMPSITVQGSADSDTVESMKEMLNRAVRELERKMPDIINSYQHRQRRVSLAT